MAQIGPSATAPPTSAERTTSMGEPIERAKARSGKQTPQISDVLDEQEEDLMLPDEDLNEVFNDADDEDDFDEPELEDDEPDDDDDDDLGLDGDDDYDADTEDKDETIRRLRAQLDEQFDPFNRQTSEQPAADDQQQLEPVALELTDEEIEDIFPGSDTGKVKGLLQRIADKAQETALRALPTVAARTVARQHATTETIKEFFEQNPKLREHRGFLGYQVQQVQQEHPDWDDSKTLQEAAKRSYQGLGIRVKTRQREQKRRSRTPNPEAPAFASKQKKRGKGGRSDRRTSLQRQIDEIVDL